MTTKLFLLFSIITCVQLGADITRTSTNSGGDATYCPGADVILRCYGNSSVLRWTAKTENTTAPPIVFHNGITRVNWFMRIDMFNISAVYYTNQQTSLLMYLKAYSSVNFTCNDNTFNVFILTEAPRPTNVTAVLFDGLITINWENPSQYSEVVKHYLVKIMNGDSPYEVNGTKSVYSVKTINPRIVSVMTVDVCGNHSIGVDAEVMDLGNATPVLTTSSYASTDQAQPVGDNGSCTTSIVALVVLIYVPFIVIYVLIPIIFAIKCNLNRKRKSRKKKEEIREKKIITSD